MKPSSISTSTAPYRSSLARREGLIRERHSATVSPLRMEEGGGSKATSRPPQSNGAVVGRFQRAKPKAPANSRLRSISPRQKPQSSIAADKVTGFPVNGSTNVPPANRRRRRARSSAFCNRTGALSGRSRSRTGTPDRPAIRRASSAPLSQASSSAPFRRCQGSHSAATIRIPDR